MRWTGHSWINTATRNPGLGGYLYGVSCSSATSCFAVGRYVSSTSTDRTLAEFWNGASWSVTKTPNVGNAGTRLNGVSCNSHISCVAVGSGSVSGNEVTVVESWDGDTWSIVTSPNAGTGSELNAVSCSNPTSCMAVGDDSISSDKWQTLGEIWNGTSWSVTPSPNPGNYDDFPSAVSCTSSTNCVTAGAYYNDSVRTPAQTLIESWSGGSWTTTPSPDPGPKTNSLSGVSCASANKCFAVGDLQSSGSHALVLTGTP